MVRRAVAMVFLYNVFFIRAANLTKLLSAPSWNVKESHSRAQGLRLFSPQCCQHCSLAITAFTVLSISWHTYTFLFSPFAPPSYPAYTHAPPAYQWGKQRKKDREHHKDVLCVCIKHSFTTWLHCYDISIINPHWVVQHILLNKYDELYTHLWRLGKQVCWPTS